MTPRVDAVENLVTAALLGMSTITTQTTGAEIVSACLTLAKKAIMTAIRSDPANGPALQLAVSQLYLECLHPETKDIQ